MRPGDGRQSLDHGTAELPAHFAAQLLDRVNTDYAGVTFHQPSHTTDNQENHSQVGQLQQSSDCRA